jgi:hypothetical protein
MMKKLKITALLISISLLAGFNLPQPQTDEEIFLNHVDACLSIIEQEAQKIPMQGVAMAAYIPGDKTEVWTSKMKVVGEIAREKANLLAIAYAKASEMAVTLENSGDESRKEIVGELGYRGGVIMKVDSGYLVAAFSGGTSQQDADVSKIGLEWLAKKF